MNAAIRRLFELLVSVAAPPACVACDARSTAPLCERCRALVIPAAPRWLAGIPVIAALTYAPPFDAVIQRLKYRARPDLARDLAALAPAGSISAGDLLVPVPLHPRRLAERGYNQAALLARALAGRSGAQVDARALVRVRDTPQQARLARVERSSNVATAFGPRRPAALRGRHVVLVDDVVTTGATALGCISALEGAGASVRVVLAVASAAA